MLFDNLPGLIEFVRSGQVVDVFRQVGVYSGTILKGAKPADLPVVQPTQFEFAINVGTAKALGIEVPEALPATADVLIR